MSYKPFHVENLLVFLAGSATYINNQSFGFCFNENKLSFILSVSVKQKAYYLTRKLT